jgi:hypothetical protein
MNRRDLLLLGIHRRARSVELSCERLYMNFCDSRLDDTTQDLFERLAGELRSAEDVQLLDTSWLASQDFRQRLEPLLESVRARGGRVSHSPEPANRSSRGT